MDRRNILGLAVQAGSLAVAGIIGIPAVLTGLSPVLRRQREAAWRPVGPLDDFPVGEVSRGLIDISRETWPRSVSPQMVHVWRPATEQVVVLSPSCTDLGCPVTYDSGSQCFFCPCHGGIFDQSGARIAGPPNRPLYRYASRIRDGVVEVDVRSLPPMA